MQTAVSAVVIGIWSLSPAHSLFQTGSVDLRGGQDFRKLGLAAGSEGL